ncbi:MAG: glutamate racemase, partial [Tissierellia bacterium]|nr:glutamate racemase [Tissierellia bacterium]
NMLSDKLDGGKANFYVSDDPEKFKRIGGNILRKEIASVQKVNIENL